MEGIVGVGGVYTLVDTAELNTVVSDLSNCPT
jgi:hypothetical protein